MTEAQFPETPSYSAFRMLRENEFEQKLWLHIASYPGKSKADYADHFGYSIRQIERPLTSLLAHKLVKREGAKKTSIYVLGENGRFLSDLLKFSTALELSNENGQSDLVVLYFYLFFSLFLHYPEYFREFVLIFKEADHSKFCSKLNDFKLKYFNDIKNNDFSVDYTNDMKIGYARVALPGLVNSYVRLCHDPMPVLKDLAMLFLLKSGELLLSYCNSLKELQKTGDATSLKSLHEVINNDFWEKMGENLQEELKSFFSSPEVEQKRSFVADLNQYIETHPGYSIEAAISDFYNMNRCAARLNGFRSNETLRKFYYQEKNAQRPFSLYPGLLPVDRLSVHIELVEKTHLMPLCNRMSELIQESRNWCVGEVFLEVQPEDGCSPVQRYVTCMVALDEPHFITLSVSDSRDPDLERLLAGDYQGNIVDGCIQFMSWQDAEQKGGWYYVRRCLQEAYAQDSACASELLTRINSFSLRRKRFHNYSLFQQKIGISLDDRVNDFFMHCRKLYQEELADSEIGKVLSYIVRHETELRLNLNMLLMDSESNLAVRFAQDFVRAQNDRLWNELLSDEQRLAMRYSFAASCRTNGIPFPTWWKDICGRFSSTLKEQYDILLPHLWEFSEDNATGGTVFDELDL